MKRIYRNKQDAKILGICSGISDYFKIDPIIIRLFFIISIFASGLGILAYLIAWIMIPNQKK
ncbi:PspC domain-containing protein [Candidatus Marinimicrobia bacterium]|nr:PspC domain-containing protein [Candidatus Neomarinimicrobiota bacterium]